MSHAPGEPHVSSQAPALYFPVEAGATVLFSRPLTDAEQGSELEVDCERGSYLAYKRALLSDATRGPFRAADIPVEVIRRAESYLRARMTQLASFRHDADRLEQLDLDGLMLELQEDVVLMLLPTGYAAERARAAYLHVCFPSGWDPAKMLGKSFVSLHARVPRERGFERADYAGHAASLFEHPGVRFVWSITPDAQLDRHPCAYRPVSWSETTRAFLRVERQLNIPLSIVGGEAVAALFVIRTYVYPVTRLTASQRDTLEVALTGMSEAMRRYKGMLGHERRIVELLRRT